MFDYIRCIGSMCFGETVDVTDPCYNRDIWCRINNLNIVPGEYACLAFMLEGEYLAGIGIFHELGNLLYEPDGMFGPVGVDSGLIGFFHNKPDYDEQGWEEFVEGLDEGNIWLKPEGFFGKVIEDGGYMVEVWLDEDECIDGMMINFVDGVLGDDDDEIYDYYEY